MTDHIRLRDAAEEKFWTDVFVATVASGKRIQDTNGKPVSFAEAADIAAVQYRERRIFTNGGES